MKKNLILGGILLATLVGIYFYNRLPQNPQKTVVSVPALISPTRIPLPTPTPIWKSYKNTKLGFSFGYPTWDSSSMETLSLESPGQLLYLHFYPNRLKTAAYINVEVYKGDQTILPPGPTPETSQKIIFNYNRKTINNISFEDYVLNGPCHAHTLQTVHSNRTYIFQDVCGPTPEFSRLISSLKFL